MNIAFFASHNGTAFRLILESGKLEEMGARPTLLITNNRTAPVLDIAVKYGVPTQVISPSLIGEEVADAAHLTALGSHQIDLVILAGYMRKIGPQTLAAFDRRIINAHPALLPKFGGKGMYGHHVHEAVIAAKEKESGVTIHYVDGEYDTGPTLLQRSIQLSENETVETLEEKIKALEPLAYLDAIKILLS